MAQVAVSNTREGEKITRATGDRPTTTATTSGGGRRHQADNRRRRPDAEAAQAADGGRSRLQAREKEREIYARERERVNKLNGSDY